MTMLRLSTAATAAVLLSATAMTPVAAQAIQNGAIRTQTAAFDNTITSNGGTVTLDRLSNLGSGSTWARSGYTITSTNGLTRGIDSTYLTQRLNVAGAIVGGAAIGIDPQNPAAGSGLTFTFANPINAFGLEIGDWATCCFPSSLYISFDGGATRLVATANTGSDNPGIPAGDGYRNFVGAFDSSGTFTKVTFYGDGFGEYLVAGGTIRYGLVDIGSVGVPEPATWAMMILGMGAVGAGMRRRTRTAVRYA